MKYMNLILIWPITFLISTETALAKSGRCESAFIGEAVADNLSTDNSSAAIKRRRAVGNNFRVTLKIPSEDLGQLLTLRSGENSEFTFSAPITIQEIVRNEPRIAEMARSRVTNVFTALAKVMGRTPTEIELAKALALTTPEYRELIGHDRLFTSFESMQKAAIEKKPNAFAKVIDLSFFDSARLKKMNDAILNRKRLVITTAVADTPINKDFFESLLVYAHEMDAEIFVFAANMQTTGLDPILLETPGVHIITNSVALSPQLMLNNIKITAKQVRPLTGIDRMGERGQSQIVGSPKLELLTIPTIDNQLNPHMLMSTGAITEPIYNSQLYIQERTSAIAAADHKLAAIVLEKSSGTFESPFPDSTSIAGFYHSRHISYSAEAKGFTDINRFFSKNGSSAAEILTISLPDIHVGEIDPGFITALASVIKKLKPQRIALHDLFNGHSVSHHERGKIISSAIRYKNGALDLESELRSVAVFLNSLLALDSKLELRIVQSNHDLWLNRWLEEGQFMKEPHNAKLGIELANVMAQEQSPLEYALKKFGLEYPKRVIHVDEGSWKEAGWEAGQHGHLGANGAKGSLNAMVRATDRSIFGHSHTTQRRGNIINIGTATTLRHGYNRLGPSSWSNSFAAISSTGEAQLFVLRNGEWWNDGDVTKGADFFTNHFPLIKPNNLPGIGQQIDQYSSRSR